MSRIVLVGMMGSGKTTLGKKLAKSMNYDFVDLDHEIEARLQLKIPEIFEQKGENYFREQEKFELNEQLKKDQIVLSVGGGTPFFFDNMDLISQQSFSVYIELDAKSLVHRLMNSFNKRPLIEGKNEDEVLEIISQLLDLRSDSYKKATLTIKGENLNAKILHESILDHLK